MVPAVIIRVMAIVLVIVAAVLVIARVANAGSNRWPIRIGDGYLYRVVDDSPDTRSVCYVLTDDGPSGKVFPLSASCTSMCR